MQFATLFDAFGVDSLEDVGKKPASKRTAFQDKVFGEDVEDADIKDVEPPIMVIPEYRKITKLEVQEFISNAYRKKGINAVWNIMDVRIQKQLLGICNKSANGIKGFFEDIFTSPEKMLAILAVLFVIIILLDISQPKAPEVQRVNMANMSEQYYYPQQQMPQMPQMPQMYYAPGGYSVNPVNIN
jgi:hypothetical protein